MKQFDILSDINRLKVLSFLRTKQESLPTGRQAEEDWIPGQARNDKQSQFAALH